MEEETIHKSIEELMVADSQDSNMDQPFSPTFLTLPPEIREMIYHSLLDQEVPIRISSPKSRTLRDLIFSSARASILYVNRQIHAEAIRVFYSANTFVVGNGKAGSTHHENERGLISFVSHVPPHLVTSITKIILVIHLRPSEFVHIPFPALRTAIRAPRREPIPTHYGLGTPGDAADVWHIAQLIAKHFKGVKSVGTDWVYAERSPERAHILPRAATVAGLTNAIRLLMKLPQAREIHFRDEKKLDLQRILDRVLKEELEMGREVTSKFIASGEGKSEQRFPHGEVRERQGIPLYKCMSNVNKMNEFVYFTRLPPEIRNNIYELLLVNEHPIPITSPRKKHAVKKEPPKTNFARLLRVNKQLNAEAKTVFYSLNGFVVGNGPFGLTTEENLHALRAFITRVPAICIHRITRVHLEINVIPIRNWSSNYPNYRVRNSCVKDLESISRALVKHFRGLESLIIGFKPYRQAANSYDFLGPNWRSLFRVSKAIEGDLASVAKAVRVVLKHSNLKSVRFQDRPYMDVDEFLETVFGDEPKVTKEVMKTLGN